MSCLQNEQHMLNTNQSSKRNLKTFKEDENKKDSNNISINVRKKPKKKETYFITLLNCEKVFDLTADIMDSKPEMISSNIYMENNTDTTSKIKKVVQAEDVQKDEVYGNATTGKLQSDSDGNKLRESTFQKKLDLIRHENKHHRGKGNSDKQFICKICDVTFNTKIAYYHHLKHVHEIIRKELSKDFPCEVCGLGFTEEQILTSHKRSHITEHLTNKSKKDVETKDTQNEEEASNATGIQLVCNICNMGLPTRHDYDDHLKNVHEIIHHDSSSKFSCKDSVQLLTEKNVVNSKTKSQKTERPYLCDVCGKAFGQLYALLSHKSIHDKIMYECHLCDYKGFNKSYLRTHMKVHCEEKKHCCDVCGKTFTLQCVLHRHQKLHLDEYPYSCRICSKKFKVAAYLWCHMKTHNIVQESNYEKLEKNFLCNVCGRRFTQQQYLKSHLRSHTNNKEPSTNIKEPSTNIKEPSTNIKKPSTNIRQSSTNIKKPNMNKKRSLICGTCGKEFHSNSAIHIHKKSHTSFSKYECNVCGYKTFHKPYLNRHMDIHSDEKKYCCKVCGKSFGHKSTLYHHRKTHIVELPYSCSICPKKFKVRKYLNYHMKTHKQLDEKNITETAVKSVIELL